MKINREIVQHFTTSPFEFAQTLQQIMHAHGLDIPNAADIRLAPGQYHRFTSRGCKNKCCEYRVFERLLGAHFKCWRRGINIIWWFKDYRTLTHLDKMAQRKERLQLQKQREMEQREAIELALITLKKCVPATDNHPYVRRKKIIPYSAFENGALLCVPVTTIEGKLMSLQSIWTNGSKRFTANSTTRGGMRFIGGVSEDLYIVCEGWATGCSIYEATGITTVCAFNAGNLEHVCEAILKKYPNKQLVLAADHDEAGFKGALAAGKKFGLKIIYPMFDSVTSNPENVSFTDFNDLFVLSGIEVVENQIQEQLQNLHINVYQQPTGN